MESITSLPLCMLGLLPSPAMLSGLGVLGLLLWGMKNPLAWVLLSVVLITAGIGCLVYGITDLIALSANHAPGVYPPSYEIHEAAFFVGGGAGGVVGGAVLLFVALLRRRKGAGPEVRT